MKEVSKGLIKLLPPWIRKDSNFGELGLDFYDIVIYKKLKLLYSAQTQKQGVEPDPNRIRKPVLTVIIFWTRTGTEPEKIKFAEPELELNP